MTLKRVPGAPPTARSLWLLPDGPGGALSSLCVLALRPSLWDVGFVNGWVAALESGACTQPWDRGRDGCCQTVVGRRSWEGPLPGGCLFWGRHLGSELAGSAPVVAACPWAGPAPSPSLVSSRMCGHVPGPWETVSDVLGRQPSCIILLDM